MLSKGSLPPTLVAFSGDSSQADNLSRMWWTQTCDQANNLNFTRIFAMRCMLGKETVIFKACCILLMCILHPSRHSLLGISLPLSQVSNMRGSSKCSSPSGFHQGCSLSLVLYIPIIGLTSQIAGVGHYVFGVGHYCTSWGPPRLPVECCSIPVALCSRCYWLVLMTLQPCSAL